MLSLIQTTESPRSQAFRCRVSRCRHGGPQVSLQLLNLNFVVVRKYFRTCASQLAFRRGAHFLTRQAEAGVRQGMSPPRPAVNLGVCYSSVMVSQGYRAPAILVLCRSRQLIGEDNRPLYVYCLCCLRVYRWNGTWAIHADFNRVTK